MAKAEANMASGKSWDFCINWNHFTKLEWKNTHKLIRAHGGEVYSEPEDEVLPHEYSKSIDHGAQDALIGGRFPSLEAAQAAEREILDAVWYRQRIQGVRPCPFEITIQPITNTDIR